MSGSGGSRSDYDTSVPIGAPNAARSGGGSSGAGAGGGGGGGGGAGGSDPCDITQDAPINSPNPAVVPGLSIGDVLEVRLSGTASRPILEVRTDAGRLAGSLTHVGHLALVRCIRSGHGYRAEVIQRVGGAVVVRIERA